MYSGTVSGLRPWCASARILARTYTHMHTQKLKVLSAVQSGRGREHSGAISSYPRCSHICPRALHSVRVRHPLGPTPAPPPASRALCRAPSHPSRGPRCVTSREAQRRGARGRSPSSGLQDASGAGWVLLVGRGAGTYQGRYSSAPRKGDLKPRAGQAFCPRCRQAPG